MKKFLLFLALILSSYLVFPQGKFTVKGKFKNYNGKVFLNHDGGRDSVITVGGAFLFNGKVKKPVNSHISIPSDQMQGISSFWIDSGETILELDTMSFKNNRFSGLDVKAKIISAGATNRFIDSVSTLINQAVKNKANDKDGDEKVRSIVEGVLSRNPHPVISLYFFSSNMRLFKGGEVAEFFAALNPELQNTTHGLRLKNVGIQPITVNVGSKLPNFKQTNQYGKLISLEEVKGAYTLIEFWASWCVPCRKENPTVVLAYKKYKRKGFEILAVSLDDKKDAWVKAIKDDGLLWKHVSDLGGWENVVSRTFGVTAVPSNFLIDQNGIVIAKNLRGKELEEKLAQIFDRK